MHKGDTLFFDARYPHGPESFEKVPARFLSVIGYTTHQDRAPVLLIDTR